MASFKMASCSCGGLGEAMMRGQILPSHRSSSRPCLGSLRYGHSLAITAGRRVRVLIFQHLDLVASTLGGLVLLAVATGLSVVSWPSANNKGWLNTAEWEREQPAPDVDPAARRGHHGGVRPRARAPARPPRRT